MDSIKEQLANIVDGLIPIIEYRRPNGIKIQRYIKCNQPSILEKTAIMITAGFRITSEYIDGYYNTCIEDDYQDYVSRNLFADGNNQTFKMIEEFNIQKALKIREENNG